MNILVFSWRDTRHPLAGGAEQVMHEHMKGWIEAGYVVTFFSSSFPGAKSEEEIDGVKVIRKGSQYLTCHMAACLWYLFGKKEKYDLVVDEFHGWPFFTPLYVRVPKLAVIQELTKEVWFKYPLPFGLNFIFGAIGYILEPLFFVPYRNVEFMTGSESAKKELETVGIKEKKITIIPHGVILENVGKKFEKEKTKTVVFLGALAKDKGIEDAIKTFGILSKTDKYTFWIIGKGDKKYLKFLKGMVNQLNIDVNFFGYVDQKKKFELLSKAHILINPSTREGWGLVNIEANACAVPVVSYTSPGLVDSVKNGVSGIVCSKNTPEELARTVDEVLKNSGKCKKLQKGALAWSAKFDWKNSKRLSLALTRKIGL